jgi:hypothetical protein
MSVATMLPSTFPLVRVSPTITEGSAGLLALLCVGYPGVWALVGGAALIADAGLHRAVEGSPWLAARPERLPGALLFGGGLFQFSPLKYSCLRPCRSPVGFVIQHWRGASRALRALRVGVLHGVYCVGCCWVLMLLTFAVGGRVSRVDAGPGRGHVRGEGDLMGSRCDGRREPDPDGLGARRPGREPRGTSALLSAGSAGFRRVPLGTGG